MVGTSLLRIRRKNIVILVGINQLIGPAEDRVACIEYLEISGILIDVAADKPFQHHSEKRSRALELLLIEFDLFLVGHIAQSGQHIVGHFEMLHKSIRPIYIAGVSPCGGRLHI